MTNVFLKIVNMSISATWLVLAVLLLRLILKKAPKWANVLLWGIVAIRLICPISIESVFSLIPSSETIRPEIMMDRTPEIDTGIPVLNEVVNPVITDSFAPDPAASANPLQILIPVASQIWFLGMVMMLLYTAISYWHLRKKVSTAVIMKDNIFQSEYVSSPFVLGIVKPQIYLSYNMSEGEMNHVIAHERSHIRRRDHWWKPLGFGLLTLHWFNPILWVAYILLCRDIELACDEKVIKELGSVERADYTQALVACSVNRRMIAACPLAFGEVGVKERVKSVMNYKKPAFWIIFIAIIVCVVMAVCFLTDPLSQNKVLEYSVTSYLTDSQETEVIDPYNCESEAISVNVLFETTEGPTSIELVCAMKKDGVGEDWTYSDPVILGLRESATFYIPADHHYTFTTAPLEGANGNVTLQFTEKEYEEEDPWTWAAGLKAENISSVQIWVEGEEPYPLTENEARMLFRHINGLKRWDFKKNTQLEGSTPTWGLSITLNGTTVYFNESISPNGDLELLLNGDQWWVECDSLKQVILTHIQAPDAPLDAADGYEYEGVIYRYKLELTGKFPNSDVETTFVVLTNREDLSFDMVARSLYSSSLEDTKIAEDYVLLAQPYDWGITLTAQDVTSTGLTIVCNQSGGTFTSKDGLLLSSVELTTGSDFWLQRLIDGEWTSFTVRADLAWTAEAYLIPINDSTEWEVDWSYIYGSLEPGQYRIGKNISLTRSPEDTESQIYYAEFTIN